MDIKHAAVIILSMVAILIIVMHLDTEGFTSKDEKAEAIYRWFRSNPNGDYKKYKNDLTKKSNIVEYKDMTKLLNDKNLTLLNVQRAI